MSTQRKKPVYNLTDIEKKIQRYWKQHKVFEANINPRKQKKYILDMFPYPSGAGLHVGHLLGYYASDVVAIYQRMHGYEVLHPMGFDAFGLPAEQHAIDTGQHPAITVKKNIKNYTKLLKATGLSFDWRRSLSTTDPSYYRWTQWIFLELFDSWYNKETNQAEPIDTLIVIFNRDGNKHPATVGYLDKTFTAASWATMTHKQQQECLRHYRLAYLSAQYVNWCPALGTVLANDEVKDGRSERGGYPVERKKMMQWSLRMQPYAERLLTALEELDWSASIKEIQRHWIGKSAGTAVTFSIKEKDLPNLQVFTTRIDTIFGVTFLAVAPEHPLVASIIDKKQQTIKEKENPFTSSPETDLMLGMETTNYIPDSPEKVRLEQLQEYIQQMQNLSERARRQEKKASGVFTGYYATHPLTGKKLPLFVADYVLMNYGLGAIMGVPAHDQRDYDFAKQFNLPIIQVINKGNPNEEAYEGKGGTLINSQIIDGLRIQEAQKVLLDILKAKRMAQHTINYRLRDPVFARQRYWGEPVPIYFKHKMPVPLPQSKLPLKLPPIESYKPTATGEPPLAHAENWDIEGYPLETSTMPAWAGSSWYFLRYMDPHNTKVFADKKSLAYWQQVDLYMGGKEHATGHLIYARFFTKFLYDRGYIAIQEPFHKLFNQGMIQSFSQLVYRIKGTNTFVSHGLRKQYKTTALRIDIHLVKKHLLDIERFKAWRPDLADAKFILEDGKYICGELLEKMSKSKYNSITPEPIIKKYGADGLRLYMLFLGPIQQDKPWSVEGIQGIARFIKKIFALFDSYQAIKPMRQKNSLAVRSALHKAIAQVKRGIERFTFNTSLSALMILANKLLEPNHTPTKATMEDFVRLLAPFAPHIAEYLWHRLGRKKSVIYTPFPTYNPAYLQEKNMVYPISINGKLRGKVTCSMEATEQDVTKQALEQTNVQKWIEGKQIKKIIFVPKRMVNIVV